MRRSKVTVLVVLLIISVVAIVAYFVYGDKFREIYQRQGEYENFKKDSSFLGAKENEKNLTEKYGDYRNYNEGNINKALTSNKTVVLFFSDKFSQNSAKADADLLSNFKQIPENVIIYKIDLVYYTDLKAKYNIQSEDTFVLLDVTGTPLRKWNSGGEAVKSLLAYLG